MKCYIVTEYRQMEHTKMTHTIIQKIIIKKKNNNIERKIVKSVKINY
jgi:hypothetical protein